MKPAEYCAFCGKHHDEVAKLVSGPGRVGICNECHDLMRGIMPEPPPDLTPEERAVRRRDFDEWLARDLAARETQSCPSWSYRIFPKETQS